MKRRTLRCSLALVMIVAACGGDASSDSTAPPTTTTEAAVTSTTAAPTTTTTTTSVPATPLEALGYPVSDEWVVETVIADIDSATGGLAIDADGVMYQSDFGYSGHPGDSVYRIAPDGTVETFVQSDEMASLTMITLGPNGTMYQSSYGSNQVYRINPDGTADVIAEGLRGPTGIVVLDDGTLIVEAYNSSIVHRIHPDGTVEDWVTDRRFNGINGLTMGPDGTLYAIDHKDGAIFSIDSAGTVEKIFQFPKPTSHGVFLDGSLFVTSRGGYVVFRYDLATGLAEIIAGNGEPGDSDGRGAESSFGRPNAITVGPDGALYFNHGGGQDNDPVSIKRITHQP